MFCGFRFKCCFLSDCVTFVKPSGAPFWHHVSEKKKRPENRFKKRDPYLKTTHYRRVRWLPGTPPCVRITQTRDNSSSSKCCSNSCPWLWFRKIARKWLLELASIANVSKSPKKWKGPISKAHFWWSDTPWAKARRIKYAIHFSIFIHFVSRFLESTL